jgi:alkaline phosphatase D
MPDGNIWRNIVTEEKSVVAHSLAQFRGNYKYNLLDANLRAFNAQVPMLAQWDDHEVTNDWSPAGTADETGYAEDGTSKWWRGRPRVSGVHADPQGADTGGPGLSPDRIRAAARRLPDRHAQLPRFDMEQARRRSDTCVLGAVQLAWLKRELAASNATWKVIAADLPIGLISEDAIALGDGPPERRECEIADLLSFMKRAGIRNTVWLTADMHYTAAHRYDPNRAVFRDFEPFGNSSRPAACRDLGSRPTG